MASEVETEWLEGTLSSTRVERTCPANDRTATGLRRERLPHHAALLPLTQAAAVCILFRI